MTTKTDGGPAFPLQSIGPEFAPGYAGMSLRDYFAAKAMVGWLASYSPDALHPASRDKEGDVAEMAYALADAMLRAREAHK
jgi:hypothetical protein